MKNISKELQTLKVTLSRGKNTTPISPILNKYIKEEYEKVAHRFLIVDFNPYTSNCPFEDFNKLKSYNIHGTIPIWSGACDNSIFGDPQVNMMFRALHDLVHLELNQPFTLEGETAVALTQIKRMPKGKEFKLPKLLIESEVVGQVSFFYANGYFIEDQRQFTLDYLTNPAEALNLKDFKTVNIKALASFTVK